MDLRASRAPLLSESPFEFTGKNEDDESLQVHIGKRDAAAAAFDDDRRRRFLVNNSIMSPKLICATRNNNNKCLAGPPLSDARERPAWYCNQIVGVVGRAPGRP